MRHRPPFAPPLAFAHGEVRGALRRGLDAARSARGARVVAPPPAGPPLGGKVAVLSPHDATTVLVPGAPLSHEDHLWLAHTVLERGPAERGEVGLYLEQPYAVWAGDRAETPEVVRGLLPRPLVVGAALGSRPQVAQGPGRQRLPLAAHRPVLDPDPGGHQLRGAPRRRGDRLGRLRCGGVDRRSAIVTGAASGIGRAIAARLEADGLDVLAVDLEPDDQGPGEPFAADLTTREGNREAVAAARERFGRLDVVVANAGFQHVAPVAEFPEDRWDGLVALLLTSPFLLAKYAWEALEESDAGRFIAIASIHGLVASPFKAGYVSAKHGVLGLVKTLALEGADKGITATAVCPGFVRTPLVEKQIADQAKAHGVPEERVLEDVILAPHAVKRLIEPDEVAGVVSFLAGPCGGAFTGAPVTMDVGWSAR